MAESRLTYAVHPTSGLLPIISAFNTESLEAPGPRLAALPREEAAREDWERDARFACFSYASNTLS